MEPMQVLSPPKQRHQIKTRLEKIRGASVIAARKGDFRRVWQLTTEANRLNQELSGDSSAVKN